MSTPRYPIYKDTGVEWLGEVPEHWEIKRIRHLVGDGSEGMKIGPFGSQLKAEMLEDDGEFKVYGQENVIACDFKRGARFISKARFSELSVYEISDGDILITMMGSSGHCALAPANITPGIMDSHLLRIRLKKNVQPRFLRLLIDEAAYVGDQVRLFGKGSIMHGLNSGIVKELIVALPPVAEQNRLLRFLDREIGKIDALVEEQRLLIELLKEKRRAVISHAVTKGLKPDALMKDSGIEWLGEVPEHWQVLRVKHVSKFTTSGPRGWSDRISEAGSIFVQSGDLNEVLRINIEGCKRVQVEGGAEADRTLLANGDIVVCITGAKTGNVAVCEGLREPAYVNQHLCLIRPNESVLPGFLGAILKSDIGQTYFQVSQYGLKQGLSLENVKEAPVPLPPLREQESILCFLDSQAIEFSALTDEAEVAILLLQERRTALISAAVTGKIDVCGLVQEDAA